MTLCSMCIQYLVIIYQRNTQCFTNQIHSWKNLNQNPCEFFFSCSLYSFAWISLVFWELLLGSYYILRWFVCKTHPRQKIDNSFVWFTVFHLHMDVCNHIFFLSTLSTIWFIFIDKILYKDVAFGLDQFVSVHFYF